MNPSFLAAHTFPSMMATASGIPFNTLARSGGKGGTLMSCDLPVVALILVDRNDK